MSTKEARQGREQGQEQGQERTERATPDPDDPRKPDDVTDLHKRSWFYVLR